MPNAFTLAELEQFNRDGYVVVPNLAPPELVARLQAIVDEDIRRCRPPVEFEAAVGYAGAPTSLSAAGGSTMRRLLQAVSRDPAFLEWAAFPGVLGRLRQLLGPNLVMPLAHHNCVMVKDPIYSSDTNWHQDIRYWAFARPELVSVQLALDSAHPETGALHFLPGTHAMAFSAEQMDDRKFLREDLPANQPLIASSRSQSLEPGDAAFFHCRTFHAARRNRSGRPTRSYILTYRAADNPPTPGTRSAARPELLLPME